MLKLLFKLRRTRLGGTAYRRLRNLAQGPGWGGFHRDAVYRDLMLDLLGSLGFTSFVETGTYNGYSTELVASRFPQLPVYSSEVMPETYNTTKPYLDRFSNIRMSLASSDEWLAGLLKTGELGAMPLFFLDAHWHTYWPLRTELKHISDAGIKATIVIDDFEVPGQPAFGFDLDGGGEITTGQPCNLDYIRPSLGATNRYKALFPKYSMNDAFGSNQKGMLRGHIVLFQNMDEQFAAAQARPHLQKFYFPFDLT